VRAFLLSSDSAKENPMTTSNQTQTTSTTELDLSGINLLPLVSNNGLNLRTKLADKADAAVASLRVHASTTMKRMACATTECVSCKFARANGSC
jgi:hypothetical protein